LLPCFLLSLTQSTVAKLFADPEIRLGFDVLHEKFELLQREIGFTEGFQEHTDRTLWGEPYLTGSLAGVSVINEHPVGLLLLGENDDLHLPRINGVAPVRKRGRQGNVSNSDVTLLDEEIDRLGVRRTDTQAVDDDFVVYLSGN